ncbi:MAG: Bug family tripartite tricarboxylate transporter substrate binding protein [Cupriavidus necator]
MKPLRPLSRRVFLGHCAAGIAAPLIAGSAFATDPYPNGPVRLLLGTAAGGPPDTNSRALAAVLSKKLNQPFVVENKVGASGAISFQALLAAPPDGRTLCYLSEFNLYAMPQMGRQNLLDDMRLVTTGFKAPSILVVASNSPFKSVAQIVEAAKKSPGSLTYGSGGIGSPAHIGMEKFKLATHTQIRHIPYKGGGEQAAALVGGELDMGLVLLGAVRGLLQSGRLRALAVTTAQRHPELSDLPTMQEAGVPNYDLSTWGGYAVRKQVPESIVDTLFKEITAATRTKSVMEAAVLSGSKINVSTSPQEAQEFLASERLRTVAFMKEIGMLSK